MAKRGNPNYGKYKRLWQEQKKFQKESDRILDYEEMKERRKEKNGEEKESVLR